MLNLSTFDSMTPPRPIKWALLTLAWLVIVAALLEIGLRIAAPLLPGRLQIGVQRVLTGQPYQVNKVAYMMTDSEHGYVLLPDLEDVTQAVSPQVSIRFSTIRLWGSRFGSCTRPVDYIVEVAGSAIHSACFTEYEDSLRRDSSRRPGRTVNCRSRERLA
jgi:hypothetical protein